MELTNHSRTRFAIAVLACAIILMLSAFCAVSPAFAQQKSPDESAGNPIVCLAADSDADDPDDCDDESEDWDESDDEGLSCDDTEDDGNWDESDFDDGWDCDDEDCDDEDGQGHNDAEDEGPLCDDENDDCHYYDKDGEYDFETTAPENEDLVMTGCSCDYEIISCSPEDHPNREEATCDSSCIANLDESAEDEESLETTQPAGLPTVSETASSPDASDAQPAAAPDALDSSSPATRENAPTIQHLESAPPEPDMLTPLHAADAVIRRYPLIAA